MFMYMNMRQGLIINEIQLVTKDLIVKLALLYVSAHISDAFSCTLKKYFVADVIKGLHARR